MALIRNWIGVVSLGLIAIGCGSQPIPTIAVEGSTITLALPSDLDVGYGTAWVGRSDLNLGAPTYVSSNIYEDLQRGEMVFTLKDQSSVNPNPDTLLQVLYITRVNADRASDHVILGTGTRFTQPVVLLNLPKGLVPDSEGTRNFKIHVARHRRVGTGGFQPVTQHFFDPTEWTGWGETDPGPPGQEIPITITDAPEPDGSGAGEEEDAVIDYTTPVEGWGPQAQSVRTQVTFQNYLDRSVPNPEFRFLASQYAITPAAWNMEITYPAHLIKILGIRLLKPDPSGGVVLWSIDDSVSTACASQATGTLTVDVADPDPDWNPTTFNPRAARGVSVVYELINQGNCESRIVDTDITLASITEYDADGVLLTTATPFAKVASDFH